MGKISAYIDGFNFYHLSKDKIKKHKAYYEILKKYCNIEVVNGRFGKKFVNG